MIIFDIEASGLSRESYPIEIAWQDSANSENFDSFLINPADAWRHWDEYAENEIHHISRDTLLLKGISIIEACARLNKQLFGKTIYSDAIEHDQRWMLKLFNEAGINPDFYFGSIYDVLDKDSLGAFSSSFDVERVTHRALEDVRQIIRLTSHKI